MNKNTLYMILSMIIAVMFFKSPVADALFGEETKPTAITAETESTNESATVITEPEAMPEINLPTIANSEVDSTEAPADSTIDSIATPVVTKIDTVVIENELLSITVAGDGARIISAKMKQFEYAEDMHAVDSTVELIRTADKGIAGTAINGYSLDNTNFVLTDSADGIYTFSGELQGVAVYKRFSLKPVNEKASYLVGVELESELLELNPSTFEIASGITESESRTDQGLRYAPSQVTYYQNGGAKKESFSKPKVVLEKGHFDWVAMTSKFFAIASLPVQMNETEMEIRGVIIDQYEKTSPQNTTYEVSLTSSGGTTRNNYDLYLGPTDLSHLKALDVDLEKSVFRGWGILWLDTTFPLLCEGVLWLLNFFFMIFKDYGVATVLITVILRLVTFPLTQSSMKSMARMRDIQPKMKEIQDKYKNNPQMLQAKMVEFYKDEGVNPLSGLGGCIPMLLQMPIMLSLFVVMKKAVELRGETTFLVPWINDLSQPERIFTLPWDIPFYGDNFAILPIVMALLMFFQNRMTMKDPNQRMMVIMMPIMMWVMFNNFPAGLTIYFTFSSVLQIVQQKFVDRNKSEVTVVK